MTQSKIKGHRIADKAITLNHLGESFKLPESKVGLNYPTHDNSGDLTLAQKNILTQMGNADGLHFHTGGGGGQQGIYTNEERDVQLLRLSMLLNATKYGIDKSVNDTFDDDTSIYYGIAPAYAPSLIPISDDPIVGGTLPTSKTYSYGITFNTVYGETNLVNASTVTTGTGLANAITAIINNVPSNNVRFNVYRCEGSTELQVVQNESLSEWDNPFNLNMDLESADKTSGLSCTRVSTRGFMNADGSVSYSVSNIASGIGKRTMSFSTPLNSVQTKDTPFEYYIQILNRGDVNRLDLAWDKNPANIPLDYEVYYTTDFIDSNFTNVVWKKFERLNKVKSIYNVPLSISTDGLITDNYIVTSNTRTQNVFTFKPVSDITCIKIKITKLTQSCNLVDLRLYTTDNSSNKLISKTFGSPQKFSDYSTLKVDIKTNGSHSNIKLGFLKNSEVVSSTVNDHATAASATAYNLTGMTVKCRVGDNTTRNKSSFDRIRISIRPEANKYIKIENCYILLDGNGHIHDDSILDAWGDMIVPVTWNNGLPYYENDAPNGNTVTSDWIYANFPNKTIGAFVINFSVVSGSLMYSSYEYSETWTSPNGQGLECSPKWNGLSTINNRLWNYNFIELVQTGKSNSQYMATDSLGQTSLERWHRHYIPLPPLIGSEDVKRLVMFFDNLLTDQEVLFDNIKLTHAKNVLTQTTGVTTIGSNGFLTVGNVLLNDNTVCSSDLPPTSSAPKSLMFGFNMASINKLILYFGSKANAGCNYAIQYATDTTADVDDAYYSPKWFPVENLYVGEAGIPNCFTGNVVGNIVYNNNIWDDHITHTFKPIYATKLRVVVFQCISSSALKVTNVKIMTAEDLSEFKQIYSSIAPATEGMTFIDDGKPSTSVSIPLFNTSGSYNVYYDNNLKIVRLIDKNMAGVIYTNKLTLSLFSSIILSSQFTGNVVFSASIDEGKSFENITLDKLHTFGNQSTSIIYKIKLLSSDAVVSAIAFLYSL